MHHLIASKYFRLILALILVSGVRLLIHNQFAPLLATTAFVDDAHFVKLAEHLTNGNWFGNYDYLTLIKMPGDVFWHALCHTLCISEFWARLLLYLFAALVVVKVFRNFIASNWASVIVYSILIFNPVTFDLDFYQISRDGIHLSSNLLFFASLSFVYLNLKEQKWYWLLLLSITFSWTFLIREEGILLLPSIVLFQLAYIIIKKDELRQDIPIIAIYIFIPWVVLLGITQFISHQNNKHYGFNDLCERKSNEYNALIGALNRVSYDKAVPFVSSHAEDRDKLYSNTIYFSTVQPYLDGRNKWKREIELPSREKVYEFGGWLEWAVRDATKEAGYYSTSATSLNFYQNASNEINLLCENSSLFQTSLGETTHLCRPSNQHTFSH